MQANTTEQGAAIILNNSSEIAQIIQVVNFWNRRWPIGEDWHLQMLDESFVKGLNEAWHTTVEKELACNE